MVQRSYQISQKNRESYEEYGYLILHRLFAPDECDEILQRIKPHATEEFAAILNPDRPEFLIAQAPPISQNSPLPDRVKHVRDLIITAEFMRNILRDQRAVSAIETLTGREIIGLQSQMLFKSAGTRYASQAWNPHQDNAYIQNPNGEYITTNLFLQNSDLSNGTMYVYPGTNKEGILPAKDVESYHEKAGANPGKTAQIPAKYKKQDLTFLKGDLLILNGNTVHGSYANTSPTKSRPLLSCSYLPRGEAYIPGKNANRLEIPLH
jgi:phytanoyl-CoA hydroxylase